LTSVAELRILGGHPYRAGHRRFAAASKGESIHGGDDRFAEVLNEVKHGLTNRLDLSASIAETCANSLMSAPAMNALSPRRRE